MAFEGHKCCGTCMAITYDIEVAAVCVLTQVCKCWVNMPIDHNGCMSHIYKFCSHICSVKSNMLSLDRGVETFYTCMDMYMHTCMLNTYTCMSSYIHDKSTCKEFMCMHILIHTHIQFCLLIYIQIHMHTLIYTFIQVCLQITHFRI